MTRICGLKCTFFPALAALMLCPISPGQASPSPALGSDVSATSPQEAAFANVLDYVKAQGTTGFLIIRDKKMLVECNWPVPASAASFTQTPVYGTTPEGALLEDVASAQKSFVSILAGVAIDKGLLDISKPVSSYMGAGWSKATPAQEGLITVRNLLEMNSGLNTDFTYDVPPGTRFRYNTEVYATMKPLLVRIAHLSLDDLTRQWLTAPLGMKETDWRQRPGDLRAAGNPTGLVTSPRDVARLGQMVLDHGLSPDGYRIISEGQLHIIFQHSPTNPSYGHLWWLNGGDYTPLPSRAGQARRRDTELIPAAPADLVEAWGKQDRKLYVVPSLHLIVVRLGRTPPDTGFDQQLWLRLMKALKA